MLRSKLRNQRNVEGEKASVLEQLEVNSFKEGDRIEASNDKRQGDHIYTDLGGDRLGEIKEDRIFFFLGFGGDEEEESVRGRRSQLQCRNDTSLWLLEGVKNLMIMSLLFDKGNLC